MSKSKSKYEPMPMSKSIPMSMSIPMYMSMFLFIDKDGILYSLPH